MKLATYKDGSRDGHLVVVSRDLSMAHYASGIATRLQQVLDDWNFLSPQLQDLYEALNHGKARHAFPFDPAMCMAPLPRACQWVEAAAYLPYLELTARARGAELPEGSRQVPAMQHGASDGFLGPCDDIEAPGEATGVDLGAQLAVVTGDVARGVSPEEALEGVRLLMLANAVTLPAVAEAERARGAAVLQGRPATAFAPVAVTPDELGAAWQGGRVHLTLQVQCNGKRFGLCETGPEMHFHFGQLIAHLCRTRPVAAGTIVGSGPVANAESSRGHACIATRRAQEILQHGAAKTEYLRPGDSILIEMKGPDGQSMFGAIEQDVAPLQ